MLKQSPRFMIVGSLTRDYLLFPNGDHLLDIPGGNAIYAAVGLSIWETEQLPAILAKVGEDYPQDWLDALSQKGFNIDGVKILPGAIDLRRFFAFIDANHYIRDDPVAHFARLGLPYPKALLGYSDRSMQVDSRTKFSELSIRQDDIPSDYVDINAVHICPLDYLTHSLIPATLRQMHATLITLDPSPGYMNPTFWSDVPSLLTGINAFLPSEEEVLSLFQGKSIDLWEIAEALASYGCEVIVIKRGERGQLLYDSGSKSRWEIPSYPSRMKNTVGAGDAFCGGFLANYRQSYNPLEAVLHGNISSSLVVEGNQPTYALDSLPGLANARIEALRNSIRKV
jgi:sugar/nucleoside kinase (ribokinase family)